MVKCSGHYGSPEKVEAEIHALFFVENEPLFKRIAKEISDEYTDLFLDMLESGDFSGKSDEVRTLFLKDRKLILVGVGMFEKLDLEQIRRAAARASKEAQKLVGEKLSLQCFPEFIYKKIPFISFDEMVEAMVEGSQLGIYKYNEFLSKKSGEKLPLKEIMISVAEEGFQDQLKDAITIANTIVDAVEKARNLTNAPASSLNAESLAKIAADMGTKLKLKQLILKKKEIQQHKMAGLLAVNKGSNNEARFIVLEYNATKRKLPLYVLVGKGVTFDSGGLSIKPASAMEDMKTDMAGAAAVLCTMYAVAKLKLPVRLVVLIPATDNMTGGSATCPGDIIQYSNGTSVEVVNTDAEGRLILADALIYAQRYKAKGVIDVATLTGACVVSLASHYTGMMGDDDEIMSLLEDAGNNVYERVWELPLDDEFEKMIKGTVSDIKNVGPRWGGAITAGAFLRKFKGDNPWVHLDIAGTGSFDEATDYQPKGGTGIGVRLLTEFFRLVTSED
jgi:leucyl aminopeptidase